MQGCYESDPSLDPACSPPSRIPSCAPLLLSPCPPFSAFSCVPCMHCMIEGMVSGAGALVLQVLQGGHHFIFFLFFAV